MPRIDKIRGEILELCSEDDWGSWELWWSVSAELPGSEVSETARIFAEVIANLVESGELIAKRHDPDGTCDPVAFDKERLMVEVQESVRPDPDQYFWFGTR
jgi:hypothetical protein